MLNLFCIISFYFFKAGIQPDHLVVVPESVSACVYHYTLRLQDNKQKTQGGAEYMIVDLAGNCDVS